MWRHGDGSDWQDLAEAALLTGAADPAAVIAQARDCAARGIPRDGGAADTGLIWRRHADPGVQALMQAWWAEAGRHPAGLAASALTAAGRRDRRTGGRGAGDPARGARHRRRQYLHRPGPGGAGAAAAPAGAPGGAAARQAPGRLRLCRGLRRLGLDGAAQRAS